MEESVDTLSKFGTTFQNKSIAILLKEPQFLDQMFDILDPNFFDSISLRWIADTILQYYSSFRTQPTIEVFKTELTKLDDESNTLASVIKADLVKVYDQLDSPDLPYIKREFLTFCKNQSLKHAILKSADLLNSGDYEHIKSVIDKAVHSGVERDVGHDWKDDFDKRILKKSRSTVKTPWPVINDIMDGGLAPGELGVIIAPSGAGKSWMLAKIAEGAISNGLKVLYYTHELSEEYVSNRIDTLVSGVQAKHLFEHADAVRRMIHSVPGNLKVKYYPANIATCATLMSHIQRLKALSFNPDLIVIDYADLLRAGERSSNQYENLGIIYKELRSLSGELQIPCWTASQTQRTALNEEIIEGDKIAESFGKIMISDFVMSVSRRKEDKVLNVARAHIIKNRFGRDAMTYDMDMNLETGIIEIRDTYDDSNNSGAKFDSKLKNKLQKMYSEVD